MKDIPFLGARTGGILRREATGVVGAITPWNVPLYLNIAKLGPALASGCTIVLKPAPDTPWSATHIGKVIAEQHRHPAGRGEHRRVLRPPDRRDPLVAIRASTS